MEIPCQLRMQEQIYVSLHSPCSAPLSIRAAVSSSLSHFKPQTSVIFMTSAVFIMVMHFMFHAFLSYLSHSPLPQITVCPRYFLFCILISLYLDSLSTPVLHLPLSSLWLTLFFFIYRLVLLSSS